MSNLSRILIVGYGSIGKRHIDIIKESLPTAEIMVLRHSSLNEHNSKVDKFTTSLKEVENFLPQAAVIATPSSGHVEIATRLALIGCHLLIEKPLSDSLSGVPELAMMVQEKKLICQIGYNLRFSESLKFFKKSIHDGLIGKPISISCDVGQFLPNWRPGKDYRHVVSSRRSLGGGVLLELSHELDYLMWIFRRLSWVSAWLGKISELEVDVEDVAYLLIGISNADSSKEILASVRMDFIRQDPVRVCTVVGENGSLRWDGILGKVDIFTTQDSCWENLIQDTCDRNYTYRKQWENFVGCIQSNGKPENGLDEGFDLLCFLEAVRESARNESRVVKTKLSAIGIS